MKRSATEILNDALELPAEARAAIASSLIRSLDDAVDEDAEALWASEIERRIIDIDENRIELIPWVEVRRRLSEP